MTLRERRSVTPAREGSQPHPTARVVEFRGAKKVVWETDGRGGTSTASTELLTQSSGNLKEGLFSYLFLPQGYPLSVTEDYIVYQFWDTVQALFSAITGLLATRAVFVGVGVGNESATAAAATLQWICKDGVSSIGRIVVASAISKQLDSDCKRFRLLADLTNDFGIFLQILSGYVAQEYFLLLICLASAFKTICGVCAGITRACLTFHFAKQQNTSDVASKDGNQETAVSLTGLLLGSLVTLIPDSFHLTWGLFFVFTALHIYSNYKGVAAVVLKVVNRHRLELCLRNDFPAPSFVAKIEGILFYSTLNVTMGATLSNVLTTTGDLQELSASNKMYRCARKGSRVHVALRKGANTDEEINAYCTAFYMLEKNMSPAEAERAVQNLAPVELLTKQGWEMDNVLLNSDEFRYES